MKIAPAASKKIIQFGYSVKVPEGIPLIDCRSIPNPYRVTDPVAQRRAVRGHPDFQVKVWEALRALETSDVIGIGCGYGVHRSGEVVNEVLYRARGDWEVDVENIGKEP